VKIVANAKLSDRRVSHAQTTWAVDDIFQLTTAADASKVMTLENLFKKIPETQQVWIGPTQGDAQGNPFSVRGTWGDDTTRHCKIRNDATTAGALQGFQLLTSDGVPAVLVKHAPTYTGTAGYAGTSQVYNDNDTADHVALGHTAVTGNRCGVGMIVGSNTTGSFIRFEIGPSYPASEMMRLTSTGLGIGTHEPIARLEVVKGSGAQLACFRNQGTVTDPTTTARVEGTDYANLTLGVDATQFYWQVSKGTGGTAKNFAIWTATVQAITLLQSTLVGINCTAPDKQLEINSATGACLRLTYDDANGTAAYYSDFAVSAAGDLTVTPSGGSANIAGRVGIGAGVSSATIALQVSNSFALCCSAEGNTARKTLWAQRALVTLTGATTSTEMYIAAGSLLLGASFCVNTAVSDDTADPDTWSAAFSGGSTATLATAAAAAQNTKVNTLIVPAVAASTTEITFTPQGGSFNGGVIEVVVYFEQLLSLANAA
jgi:hypothetical protein